MMAGPSHNEYVADSEDEDLLVDPTFDTLNTSIAAPSIHTPDTSIDIPAKTIPHIPAIPALPALPQASTSSTSPERTDAGSALSDLKDPPSEPSKPRPRPKPRPKYKIQPSEIVADSIQGNSPSVITHVDPSISGLPPPLPLPMAYASIPPALPLEFVGDIAERTKMRSRVKALEGGQKRKSIVNDVIELTSDSDDEMSLLPPTKAKGKAKDTSAPSAKRRSPKRPKIVDDTNTNMTSATPLHSSSQLPPSDPPPLSSSVPMTLHLGLDSSPPTSPIPQPPPRKRKRATVLQSDDELQVDGESQKLMPPPPPRLAPAAAEASSHQLTAAVPTEAEQSSSKVEKPKLKPKPKGRKKNLVEEEDDWKEDPIPKGKGKKSIVDDDDDDDWLDNPKSKPKSRKTQKKTKATDGAETKAKGKGKGKQAGPPLVLEVLVSPPKRSSPQKPSLGSGEKEELDMLPCANAATQADSPSDVMQDIPIDTVERTPQLGKGGKGKGKARKRAVMSSDEDESDSSLTSRIGGKKQTTRDKITFDPPLESRESPTREGSSKENDVDMPSNNSLRTTNTTPARAPPSTPITMSRASSVIPKTTNTPMSELIRRVNSKPGSPFTASRPSYSPFAKSSKSMLKRIAPLHPNRRTPPPPPPRPPPPKKTKKQLEMEERWEMELEDTVEGWFAMGDEERAALRRAKRDAVFGVDD